MQISKRDMPSYIRTGFGENNLGKDYIGLYGTPKPTLRIKGRSLLDLVSEERIRRGLDCLNTSDLYDESIFSEIATIGTWVKHRLENPNTQNPWMNHYARTGTIMITHDKGVTITNKSEILGRLGKGSLLEYEINEIAGQISVATTDEENVRGLLDTGFTVGINKLRQTNNKGLVGKKGRVGIKWKPATSLVGTILSGVIPDFKEYADLVYERKVEEMERQGNINLQRYKDQPRVFNLYLCPLRVPGKATITSLSLQVPKSGSSITSINMGAQYGTMVVAEK